MKTYKHKTYTIKVRELITGKKCAISITRDDGVAMHVVKDGTESQVLDYVKTYIMKTEELLK